MQVLFVAHTLSGFSLLALVGAFVSCRCLARTCSAFCSLGLVVTSCLLLLAIVARACRLCTLCGSGALGDERHLVFECGALAGLRAKCAHLFEGCGRNMRAFFAQRDYLGVFHYVIDCLNFMNI